MKKIFSLIIILLTVAQGFSQDLPEHEGVILDYYTYHVENWKWETEGIYVKLRDVGKSELVFYDINEKAFFFLYTNDRFNKLYNQLQKAHGDPTKYKSNFITWKTSDYIIDLERGIEDTALTIRLIKDDSVEEKTD